jgi:transcriptional regulator GlxA family with amidase domain
MDLVRDVSARTPPSPRSAPAAGLPGLGQAPATADILDPALRLLRLLDSPKEIPALAELHEREIIFRILMGPLGSRLWQRVREDSVADRISKAIAWLQSNFSKPLLVPRLAQKVGMSESAFYESFKTVTALTPLQYRKRLQLQAARQLMVVAGANAGTAGYEVGYQSPAQFSRDYRRLFGRSPVEDRRSGPGLR